MGVPPGGIGKQKFESNCPTLGQELGVEQNSDIKIELIKVDSCF